MRSQIRPISSLVLASLLEIFFTSGIESVLTPPNSDCSSIVPISINTDTSCNSMNNTVARDMRDNTIIPKLERIQATMTTVFDHSSFADIGDEELTYNVWRDGSHQLITVGETPENTIDLSVNRFKCMAVAVADIVVNESIHSLIDEEEPHFANEFQLVLGDLDVLLDITAILFGARLIPCDTSLSPATCANYCALERDVQIKSVAFELKSFPAEMKETLILTALDRRSFSYENSHVL